MAIFDSKLRLTKYVQSVIFQKSYKDNKNFIVLGGTKGFKLKIDEIIAHLLHSYSSDKQLEGGSASEQEPLNLPGWKTRSKNFKTPSF